MRKPNSAGMLPFLMHQQYIAENFHAGASKHKPPSREEVPQVLKELRRQSNLSQSEAAKLCRSTIKEWRDWESGRERMHPTIFRTFLRALVEHHGWPVSAMKAATHSNPRRPGPAGIPR